jgi:hypothetical protein
MPANRPKTWILSILSMLVVFIACSKEKDEAPDPTPTDPVSAVLNLPSTPYNYAN